MYVLIKKQFKVLQMDFKDFSIYKGVIFSGNHVIETLDVQVWCFNRKINKILAIFFPVSYE